MPRKQNTADILSATGRQAAKSESSNLPDFYKKMVTHPNPKQAMVMVREHAGYEFNQSDDGAELERRVMIQSDFDAQLELSQHTLDEHKKALKHTPKHIKISALKNTITAPLQPQPQDQPEEQTATVEGDTETNTETQTPPPQTQHQSHVHDTIAFKDWRVMDQILSIMLGLAVLATMFISGGNVYANLMASGEPVFLEQPWLAMCIAALAPFAAMSVKLIAIFFEYANTKKRYAFVIYVLTLLVMIVWTIAFSMSFKGVSGGLDLDALLEGDGGKGAFLVWCQLACEILVAASLFLALDDITLKYSPFILTENPDYRMWYSALEQHQSSYEKLNKKRSENYKMIVRLESRKNIFMHERLADFNALRSRVHALNTL